MASTLGGVGDTGSGANKGETGALELSNWHEARCVFVNEVCPVPHLENGLQSQTLAANINSLMLLS